MGNDYYSQVIAKIENLKDEGDSGGCVSSDSHLDLLALGLVQAYFSDNYAEQKDLVERIYERMKSPECSLTGVNALSVLLQCVLDHSQNETINGVLLAPRRRRKKRIAAGSKGGAKAAENNPKTAGIQQVREMWLDWYSGNKDKYKYKGKTNKTAFARYVLDNITALESEQWILTKMRVWEKEERAAIERKEKP